MVCCQQWKEIYDHTSRVHNTFSAEGWVLDESSIFAQIDAFIQRCRDLLEVAEGQIHFGRWDNSCSLHTYRTGFTFVMST